MVSRIQAVKEEAERLDRASFNLARAFVDYYIAHEEVINEQLQVPDFSALRIFEGHMAEAKACVIAKLKVCWCLLGQGWWDSWAQVPRNGC